VKGAKLIVPTVQFRTVSFAGNIGDESIQLFSVRRGEYPDSNALNGQYQEIRDVLPIPDVRLSRYVWSMMDWLIFLAVNVTLAVIAATIWRSCVGPKPPTRKPRIADEEFRIEPSTVAEFKPTWRNAR